MSKETNEEKEFAKNLDRLLTGEEVTGGEDVSQDYRTAINFAQKLIELRDEPSSRFKDQLKQRLLLQLTRQEVEAARQKEKAFSFWEFPYGFQKHYLKVKVKRKESNYGTPVNDFYSGYPYS